MPEEYENLWNYFHNKFPECKIRVKYEAGFRGSELQINYPGQPSLEAASHAGACAEVRAVAWCYAIGDWSVARAQGHRLHARKRPQGRRPRICIRSLSRLALSQIEVSPLRIMASLRQSSCTASNERFSEPPLLPAQNAAASSHLFLLFANFATILVIWEGAHG